MNVLYRFGNHFIDLINRQILGYNRLIPLLVSSEFNDNLWSKRSSNSLIDDIMSDGFVFATQKKRRTVEKRLVRRFGVEAFPDDCRIIRPKNNIIVCDDCGHFHELHTICGNCYKRVREESKLIIDKIRQHFRYDEPIEEEVNIRYKDDNENNDIKSGRIVEMDGKRPEWFAPNLLSKTAVNKWIERNTVLRDDDIIKPKN